MTRRHAAVLLGLLAAGCASHSAVRAAYDFDAIEPPPAPGARLTGDITVSPVTAPSWLRSPSLLYRLDYAKPALLASYAHTRWAAPPAELLGVRLQQLLGNANTGVTLSRPIRGGEAYRLEVTIEHFEQAFSSPQVSHCLVTLRATVSSERNGRVLAQRSFLARQSAVSADPAGAARGLVEASDQCLEELLRWLKATIEGGAAAR